MIIPVTFCCMTEGMCCRIIIKLEAVYASVSLSCSGWCSDLYPSLPFHSWSRYLISVVLLTGELPFMHHVTSKESAPQLYKITESAHQYSSPYCIIHPSFAHCNHDQTVWCTICSDKAKSSHCITFVIVCHHFHYRTFSCI